MVCACLWWARVSERPPPESIMPPPPSDFWPGPPLLLHSSATPVPSHSHKLLLGFVASWFSLKARHTQNASLLDGPCGVAGEGSQSWGSSRPRIYRRVEGISLPDLEPPHPISFPQDYNKQSLSFPDTGSKPLPAMDEKRAVQGPPLEVSEAGPSVTHDEFSMKADAREAALAEHSITFLQAFKTYPKAMLWSIAVSTAIIMEGYDIVLVTSLFAQPAFTSRYGTYSTKGGWQIPGPWQSALGTAPTIGAIFGAFANGYLTHKFGYRKVLLVSLLSIIAFIFLLFFATSTTMLLIGLIFCGIPWGVFATMAPAYASEVCPLALRGYLTVYVNL